jgi:hypothetical protein
MESRLPWNGKVRIKVEPSGPAEFTLHLRIPSWISVPITSSIVKINGEPHTSDHLSLAALPQPSEPTAQGYDPRQSYFLSIRRHWSADDILEMDFDMPVNLHHVHPKVKGYLNKVAVTRGPLVYCLESIDNPGVDIFSTRLDTTSLQSEPAPEMLGGITILRGQTVGPCLHAIRRNGVPRMAFANALEWARAKRLSRRRARKCPRRRRARLIRLRPA